MNFRCPARVSAPGGFDATVVSGCDLSNPFAFFHLHTPALQRARPKPSLFKRLCTLSRATERGWHTPFQGGVYFLCHYSAIPKRYAHLTRLESTFASHRVNADSKALTRPLNPLESTFTKKRGKGVH